MQFYIDPILISIGPLEIRYYGLVYAIGLLLLYVTLQKKRRELSLSENDIDSLLLHIGLGVIIGGRIGHFLFSDPLSLLNPLTLLSIWNGGMSFFGALGGIILAGILFFRKKSNASFLPTADITAVVMSGILIFGRIANFINQELVGRASDAAWCFYFKIPGPELIYDTVCRHPYQLYAAGSHLLLFIILFIIYKKSKKVGTTFISFLLGYSLLRFITDFYRFDTVYAGLTIWQYLSLATIILTLIYIWRKNGFNNTKSTKRKKHEKSSYQK